MSVNKHFLKANLDRTEIDLNWIDISVNDFSVKFAS